MNSNLTITNKNPEKMCGWCYGFNTFDVDIKSNATFVMYCSNCSSKTSTHIKYTNGVVTMPN